MHGHGRAWQTCEIEVGDGAGGIRRAVTRARTAGCGSLHDEDGESWTRVELEGRAVERGGRPPEGTGERDGRHGRAQGYAGARSVRISSSACSPSKVKESLTSTTVPTRRSLLASERRALNHVSGRAVRSQQRAGLVGCMSLEGTRAGRGRRADGREDRGGHRTEVGRGEGQGGGQGEREGGSKA